MGWVDALAETGWLVFGWLILFLILLVISAFLVGCRHPSQTRTCTYWKVDGGNEVQCR